MSLLAVTDELPAVHHRFFILGQELAKEASDASPAYALSGMLYLSGRGFACLSVPNALVRGVFDAMDEPGAELPPSGPDEDRLNAHITVMRPEEIAAFGGPEKLTERGKRFRYRIGGLVTAVPSGWPDISRVWMLRVYSPELQSLRKSYGLTPLPNNNQFDFHISVAARKKGVLGKNEVSKATTATG
jgi:hypothetical protein